MKRLNLIFVRTLFLAALFSTAGGARAAFLFDQRPFLYSTDFDRGVNWQSKGGVPLSSTSGDPVGSNGSAPNDTTPTPRQFSGGIVYGAVTYQKASNLAAGSLPANARRENLDWPRIENADGTIRLVLRAQSGAPYMMRAIAFFFGSVVPSPDVNEAGSALTTAEQAIYWAAEPYTTTDHSGPGYYWSPHAQRVYATQPGRIDLTWRRRSGVSDANKITGINYAVIGGLNYALLSTNFVVSGATVKPPRKMYWTEGRYRDSGKPVSVPTARVGDVKIVYNNAFPEFVGKENAIYSEGDEPYITNRTDRTLWYDATTTRQILARNKEGRVFVELLGDVRGTGPHRNQLGFEIVDVVRQPTPSDLTIELGEKLTPPGELASELFPEPLLSSIGKKFAFQHNVAGSDEIELYATRETKNLNDYQVFWMEESIAGLRWPAALARYKLVWPGSPAKYSHYVRPSSDQEVAKMTAVVLPTENVPTIEYQDLDPQGKPRAALTEDFKFFSFLDSTISAHRTLLRFTSGDDIAFERVLSLLDSSVKAAGFDGSRDRAINSTFYAGPGVSPALDLSPNLGSAYGEMPAGNYFDGGSFTVESWVYLRSHRYWSRLIDFGDSTYANNVLVVLSSGTSGKPRFHVRKNGDSFVETPDPLPLNEWIHLAAVFHSTGGATGTGTIYTNGVPAVSGTINTPANVNRPDVYVGRSNSANDAYADAQFDNLRIWSIARTPAQLAADMRSTYPAGTTGLVAQFQFGDEGTGSNLSEAPDSSGNAHTMSLFNASLNPTPIVDVQERARFVEETVYVGQRLAPPSGETASDGNLPYLAGYIKRAEGTGFSVTAYRDPFAVGFESAAAGAIIPINAGFNNSAKLEVWWYRKNNANLAKGFSTIYWPAVVGRYSIQWPPAGSHAREIILASNDGSGGLESLEAKGTIYTQNDPTKAGYNPNEEHALMLGGQAYALRDDLNVTTSEGYTSDPYVLLEHSDGHGRPDMKVFKVLREKPEAGILFDYITEAGTPLQAPMPLPLLPKPVEGSGETAKNYINEPNAENGDLPVNWSTQDEGGPYGLYRKFTFQDRKNQFWVYRGVHSGLPALAMGSYNATSKAFDALTAASAIVGTSFTYTLHVARRSESLVLSAGTSNPLPAWLRFDNMSLTGTPVSGDVGVTQIDLVLRDNRDDSQVTATLQLTVLATGSPVTQGPLEITSANAFAGADVTYVSRPPYLAASPTAQNSFTMRFYYRTQEGFAWPGIANPPPVDSIVPYLRPKDPSGGYLGDAASKNTESLDIVYRPAWPSTIPKLQFGDTLTTPKLGLPAVRGQTSVQVLYQQSITQDIDTPKVSAVLHDPTREKSVDLADHNLAGVPPSVRTENYQGKVFFPNLPPHLIERFFYDPSRSATGKLVLKGEFRDEPVGLKYVLLNVLRGTDLQAVKDLTPASDSQNKSKWDAAVSALATTLETFHENPDVPKTYIPDTAKNVTIGIGDLAEIHDSNTAVDSYALSASGPGQGFLTLVTANGSAFTPEGDPVSMYVLQVGGSLVSGELKILPSPNPLSELLTIQHTADLAGRFDEYEYEWRIAPPVDGFPPAVTASLSGWSALASGNGIPFYTLGGSGIQVLVDNYLIMRYRPKNSAHPLVDQWSNWTEPQLAEGWIKRVLAGINPFNQRVTDLFNNAVNTDVSILTQAGGRWEGDVALNLETINDSGLIAIYETVLRRGKQLSIESGINFGPANDALLLAAGYLNDLYLMLGNEAWADAANPTIGIGTQDKTYGDIATALFAFKGQMASLLDEELALLRGRDDFLQPGVEISPVYNRLFWNYTRGIDSGEVIYALNYNIQENNDSGVNGVINADDARKMFPQGHGDAYGHYLTALTGYYSLLLDTDFDWVPRIEAVTVLGKAVSVDYQDERKFASAAAAVARAGRQVFDLTWRADYKAGSDVGWKHLSPTRTNNRRNVQMTRYWGADHWASRTGQGAYISWAMGNAILPDVDPDPTHEGIQKVDRTTVPELKELPATADDMQTALDNAEGHLTPLGLADGSLAFDINPTQVTGPTAETHFEQVYDRSKRALNNALTAFDDAKDVTRLMRSEQDSLAELQSSVLNQEIAYSNALIEIYGTPYPDDIGPGKTYVQEYSGPDLLHYLYVDTAELTFPDLLDPSEEQTYKIDIQSLPEARVLGAETQFDDILSQSNPAYSNDTHYIEFVLSPHGFFGKPQQWKGRRTSPGRVQQAISDIVKGRNSVLQALDDMDGQKEELDGAIRLFKQGVSTTSQIDGLERDKYIAEFVTQGVEVANDIFQDAQDSVQDSILKSVDVIKESLPRSLIAGLAAGGDLTAPARGAVEAGGLISAEALEVISKVADAATKLLRLSNDQAAAGVDLFQITPLSEAQDYRQQVYDLTLQFNAIQDGFATLNARLQALDDAKRQFRALVADGDRIQAEREIFRQRSAALVQGFRTRDAAFRIFRNEKLERYKTLFDLAARYAFLTANAYDYETGLLHTRQGSEFINRIVNSRALGVMRNGEPQFAGSNTGDPGLSSVLAEMKADFDVLKGRLGFNNPNGYGTTVSLRLEKERIIPATDGDSAWQDVLERARRANILDDSDVLRYCMQIDRGNGLPVPGIVLEFSTTIEDGVNLFGQVLAGGDHYFDTSSFATKLFAVGVAFEGYVGMDNPVANTSAVGTAGGYSPPDPNTSFLGSKSLAATPGIYLIPVGVDSMRSPPLGDGSEIRSWNVDDVAIPLPFNIGGSDLSTKALWQSNQSLSEQLFSIRKHPAFRPVSTVAAFGNDIYFGTTLRQSQFTNNRLIGRSAWNTKWKLVIPGHKLLGDPNEGLDRFIQTVKDIKLRFVTYSYAGN